MHSSKVLMHYCCAALGILPTSAHMFSRFCIVFSLMPCCFCRSDVHSLLGAAEMAATGEPIASATARTAPAAPAVDVHDASVPASGYPAPLHQKFSSSEQQPCLPPCTTAVNISTAVSTASSYEEASPAMAALAKIEEAEAAFQPAGRSRSVSPMIPAGYEGGHARGREEPLERGREDHAELQRGIADNEPPQSLQQRRSLEADARFRSQRSGSAGAFQGSRVAFTLEDHASWLQDLLGCRDSCSIFKYVLPVLASAREPALMQGLPMLELSLQRREGANHMQLVP